jgi:uncharacterized membrane protein
MRGYTIRVKTSPQGGSLLFSIFVAMACLPGIGMADMAFQYTALNFPGVQNTLAYGINDSGEIVGYYWDPSTTSGGDRGFTYDAGVWTTQYVPSSFSTDIYGINNSATLVGSYNDSTFTVVKGIVIANGQLTLVAPPGTTQSEDYGLNNAGDVVGSTFAGTTATGFFDVGGSFTTIAFPDAVGTFPHGINDNGSIVGFYRTVNDTYGGFLDSTSCPECFVPVGLNGAYSTFAYGINNSNLIVGVTEDASGNKQGFLLDGTTYTLLDFPGAVNTYAAGVNDRDQIVGWYDDANGNSHAFVANPVPEPAPGWALFVILLILAGRETYVRRQGVRNQPPKAGSPSA